MSSSTRSNSAQRSLIRTLLLLLLPVLIAQTAPLGLMVGELMISWSAHLGSLLLLLVPLLLWARCGRWALLALLGAGLGLWPWLLPAPRASRLRGPGLKIISANTFHKNAHQPELERAFTAAQAQLVALIEPPSEMPLLMVETGRWRILTEHISGGKHNIALLMRKDSELEVLSAQGQSFSFSPTVILRAELRFEGRPLLLLVVHIPAPTSLSQQAQRDRLREALLDQLAAARPGPVVLLGDFNSTLVSPMYRAFLKAGLQRPPGDAVATWPGQLGPLGLAIDHALVSPELAVAPLKVIALPESDHRGIIVKLGWPPPMN